jgi:rRNA maturation endonuclease Nob1
MSFEELDYEMCDGMPAIRCTNCEMIFAVVWNRNPLYDGIEFCPFCGAEDD